jgi:hypothetical protein
VGRVTVYARNKTWYFRYHENGQRRQVRGTDKHATRQLAAQVNAQLEVGLSAATSFEAVAIPELRRRWLDYHEHVLWSSVATIDRYRAATDHLLSHASHFRPPHAEDFVRYLRQLRVAPNGHANTARRHLRDKGVKYILEVSRTLFAFALKGRHLPPYSENPFTTIQIDRIPVEDAKPVTIFTPSPKRPTRPCAAPRGSGPVPAGQAARLAFAFRGAGIHPVAAFLWRFAAGGFPERLIPRVTTSFRVGRVKAYPRGRICRGAPVHGSLPLSSTKGDGPPEP